MLSQPGYEQASTKQTLNKVDGMIAPEVNAIPEKNIQV